MYFGKTLHNARVSRVAVTGQNFVIGQCSEAGMIRPVMPIVVKDLVVQELMVFVRLQSVVMVGLKVWMLKFPEAC